jgi:hypothetical protein
VSARLSFSRTWTSLTTDEQARVTQAINSGLRRFYMPPVVKIDGRDVMHEWSFLKPVTSITTDAPYSTGTITIVAGTVTLASGTWPTWAADGNLNVSNTSYTVASRTSDSVIVLDDTTATAAAGTTYSLLHNDYDLPDTFGALEGPLTFYSQSGKAEIRVVSDARIRVLRQTQKVASNWPTEAAVRPRDTAGATGQRWELMLWPDPDASYFIQYRYIILMNALVSSSSEYPVGGMLHSETLLSACLYSAALEIQHDEHTQQYEREWKDRLMASVIHDRRAHTAEWLPYNADPPRGGWRPASYNVTQAGVLPT